jgi:hypothetical protein
VAVQPVATPTEISRLPEIGRNVVQIMFSGVLSENLFCLSQPLKFNARVIFKEATAVTFQILTYSLPAVIFSSFYVT